MANTGALNHSPGQEIRVSPSQLVDADHIKYALCNDVSLNQDSRSQSSHTSKAVKKTLLNEETRKLPDKDSLPGPIVTLNDDCLLHIFGFLQLKQLIPLERVCKRWQELCQRFWRKIRTLDLPRDFNHGKNNFFLDIDNVEDILLKCSNRLKSLTLGSRKGWSRCLFTTEVIGRFCPNLEHISMEGDELRAGFSSEFFDNAEKLKTIELTECFELRDEHLKPLLVAAKSLEKLMIYDSEEIDGSCLIFLNTKIKHLNFHKCNQLEWYDRERKFEKAMRRLTDLEHLSISSQFTHFYLSCLESCRESIKELYFREGIVDSDDLNIPTFPNLRVFKVITRSGCVFNPLLARLPCACPNLEELDISGTSEGRDNLTDTEFRSLVAFEKLKSLRVNWRKMVTSASLEYLARYMNCPELYLIAFRGCELLTNSGPLSLIAHFPNLTQFDLGYCLKIQHDFIKSALDLVKLRTNNIPLTLYVTGIQNQVYKDGDRILLTVLEASASTLPE